jgi:hypothetical protein
LAGARDGQLAGEATPIYTWWPKAAERIQAYRPDVKLIVLFRHPGERAFSHWVMETARGRETVSFSEAIRAGRARLAEGEEALRTFSYVERGFYAGQAELLLSLFGPAQLLFLRCEDLRDHHAVTLDRICAFLGIAPFEQAPTAAYVTPVEVASVPLIAAEDREHLAALYRADIERTAALTGLDLSAWR